MTEPSSQSNRESLSHGGVFVGRQQEMAVLERALNDPLSGHGRLGMPAGAPGTTKRGSRPLPEGPTVPQTVHYQPPPYERQEKGRACPPSYLHQSWIDFLYWDTELAPN